MITGELQQLDIQTKVSYLTIAGPGQAGIEARNR
jgi:hypothetical protein